MVCIVTYGCNLRSRAQSCKRTHARTHRHTHTHTHTHTHAHTHIHTHNYTYMYTQPHTYIHPHTHTHTHAHTHTVTHTHNHTNTQTHTQFEDLLTLTKTPLRRRGGSQWRMPSFMNHVSSLTYCGYTLWFYIQSESIGWSSVKHNVLSLSIRVSLPVTQCPQFIITCQSVTQRPQFIITCQSGCDTTSSVYHHVSVWL